MTTMFSSAARGWTCGVLKPQGPRKPSVMLPWEPMRAGKVSRSALTVLPPIEVLAERRSWEDGRGWRLDGKHLCLV